MIQSEKFNNMSKENLLLDFLKEFKSEIKSEIKDLRHSTELNYNNLDARVKSIETNISVIKSIFTHWKIILVIIVCIAMIDPHPILKTIKEVYGVFN